MNHQAGEIREAMRRLKLICTVLREQTMFYRTCHTQTKYSRIIPFHESRQSDEVTPWKKQVFRSMSSKTCFFFSLRPVFSPLLKLFGVHLSYSVTANWIVRMLLECHTTEASFCLVHCIFVVLL